MKLTDVLDEKYESVSSKNISAMKRSTPYPEKLRDLFREIIDSNPQEKSDAYHKTYDAVFSYIHTISPDQITSFCSDIMNDSSRSEQTKSGYFLSALINAHAEKTTYDGKYLLILHPEACVQNVGYRNCANVHIIGNSTGSCQEMNSGKVIIDGNVGNRFCWRMRNGIVTVLGNAGDFLCWEMIKGSVHIQGSAENQAGYGILEGTLTIEKNVRDQAGWRLNGGKITIKGNAGHNLGQSMKRGNIFVQGNAGRDTGVLMEDGDIFVEGNVLTTTGNRMEGGTIKINGNYESISPNCRGIIYHKGKKVW